MAQKWDGPTKEVERCLAPVRWLGARLQQKWLIATVTDGGGSEGLTLSERTEWRDVPTEIEP